MLRQEFLGVFPALAQSCFPVGVEGARFLDDALGGPQLQEVAHPADALVEHNVELGNAERSRYLVLDDAGPYPVAYYLGPLFDGFHPPKVDAD